MKRTQIYLTNKENLGIVKIIKENGGGTKADIIRRALDEYIQKYCIKEQIKLKRMELYGI